MSLPYLSFPEKVAIVGPPPGKTNLVFQILLNQISEFDVVLVFGFMEYRRFLKNYGFISYHMQSYNPCDFAEKMIVLMDEVDPQLHSNIIENSGILDRFEQCFKEGKKCLLIMDGPGGEEGFWGKLPDGNYSYIGINLLFDYTSDCQMFIKSICDSGKDRFWNFRFADKIFFPCDGGHVYENRVADLKMMGCDESDLKRLVMLDIKRDHFIDFYELRSKKCFRVDYF